MIPVFNCCAKSSNYFFHVNFDAKEVASSTYLVMCKSLAKDDDNNQPITGSEIFSFFSSFLLQFSRSRREHHQNDGTTSQTVSRYFVPYRIQIAELPPYHTFWPPFGRFLIETWIDNFQRWYKTQLSVCGFFPWGKRPNEFLYIRRYFRSSI